VAKVTFAVGGVTSKHESSGLRPAQPEADQLEKPLGCESTYTLYKLAYCMLFHVSVAEVPFALQESAPCIFTFA
jgi:hypothetical protein